MSFLGALVPLFRISGDISSGVQSQSGFYLILFFAEANVMYIPQDQPLVLHVQPVSSQLGFEWVITRTEDEHATIVPATQLTNLKI